MCCWGRRWSRCSCRCPQVLLQTRFHWQGLAAPVNWQRGVLPQQVVADVRLFSDAPSFLPGGGRMAVDQRGVEWCLAGYGQSTSADRVCPYFAVYLPPLILRYGRGAGYGGSQGACVDTVTGPSHRGNRYVTGRTFFPVLACSQQYLPYSYRRCRVAPLDGAAWERHWECASKRLYISIGKYGVSTPRANCDDAGCNVLPGKIGG